MSLHNALKLGSGESNVYRRTCSVLQPYKIHTGTILPRLSSSSKIASIISFRADWHHAELGVSASDSASQRGHDGEGEERGLLNQKQELFLGDGDSCFDPFGLGRKNWQIKPETRLYTPDARLRSSGKIFVLQPVSQD
jgi:hypothetical protein